MRQKQVIVVGGGASGMVAAIAAASQGADVTLIEQKDRVGKKILSTGNGRCNLTNSYMVPECFRGDDISVVSQVLEQFGYEDTVRFFEELGVIVKDRQGYVYPISDQASTILDVLRMELEHQAVQLILEQSVKEIRKTQERFVVKTTHQKLEADAVILATGGKAASVLGSDGSGYQLAKSLGHHISPVVPALVQLKGKGTYFKQIAGVRTQAKVSLYVDGHFAASDTGELQLTNYGISGIPVFQVSRYAAKGLVAGQPVIAELDFLPSQTEEEFQTLIERRMEAHGHKSALDFFIGVFHKKLIEMLLKMARIPYTEPMNKVESRSLHTLLRLCKHFRVEIEHTNGFDAAQVCAGGVCTQEIDAQTMESRCVPGLYLTGELLDIDGICGGYNLQWAWSTGYIAGTCAGKENR